MTPDLLARVLQEFLAEARRGVVIEDGQVVFELDSVRHSISAERGRCLVHFWSEERNLVREVLEAELKQGTLTLSVRRFAKARPHKLEICRDRDRRSHLAKREMRAPATLDSWSACCTAIRRIGAWANPGWPPVWTWSTAFRRSMPAAWPAKDAAGSPSWA